MTNDNILSVENLKMYFPVTGGIFGKKVAQVHAVDGVSFKVKKGETLGIVGESGCGKSTLGKSILQLYRPTSGVVKFEGQILTEISEKKLRDIRRDFQIIFQDPYESLDPRMSVLEIITEPFVIHQLGTKEERLMWAKDLLTKVGLPQSALDRYPHEFSGGQRQRLGIARAIALKPKLILCDEPVSALDVSVQSQILNLLVDLQREMGLTYLFIAHDLSVVKHISDRIAVMYLGRIVELAPADDLYRSPLHPYSQALLKSIPEPDPSLRHELKALDGEVPSPITPPAGCHFHTRCPYVQDICRKQTPELREIRQSLVACHFAEEIKN